MKLKESYSVPEVGPFFIIPFNNKEMVFANTVEITDAEDFGDFKTTSNSHYDYWHKLQKTYPKLKKIDYDYYPRGRVVYDKKNDKFRLFLDDCINNQECIDLITDELNVPLSKVVVMKDEHYQCHNCNEFYLDIFENQEI